MIDQLSHAPFIPIITSKTTLDVVDALYQDGFKVIEIVLRFPESATFFEKVRSRLPNAVLLAGTILSPAQFQEAQDLGADIVVSPGATPELVACAKSLGVPWLPGVSTPSEVMFLREQGFLVQKLFPAAVLGIAWLKAIKPVIPDVQFVVSGGVKSDVSSWLSQQNVLSVAASWTPSKINAF